MLRDAWRTWRRLGRQLAPFMRPERGRLAVVVVLSLVATAVGLLPPILARYLVDHVMLGSGLDLLFPLLALGMGLSVLALALGGLNRWLYTQATTRALARLREALLQHLLQVPLPRLLRQRTGDLVSRINSDAAELQRAFTDTGLQAFSAGIQAVGAGMWLFVVDARLAWVSLLVAPGLLLVVRLAQSENVAIGRDLRGLTGEANAFLTENLQGAAFIQVHEAAPVVRARYGDWHRRFNDVIMRQVWWNGWMGALPSLVMGLNGFLILGWGTQLIQAQQLTVGGLVAFIAYQWRFYGPLRGLVGLGLRWQQAQAALERIDELWRWPSNEEPAGMPALAIQSPVEVALQDVVFGYEPDRPVIRGVSAVLPAGRMTALLGPNGSGKTTLLHLIAKLLTPQSGAIVVNDQDLAEVAGAGWREQLALAAQDGVFFHGTVADHLRLAAPTASDEALHEVLVLVGLAETVAAWPEGMGTWVGDRGLRLSGGQRQRLSLARALIRDPELLILDEATSAVAQEDEGDLWERIVHSRRGRTTLVVTHRPEVAQRADLVWRLEGGRLVVEEPVG